MKTTFHCVCVAAVVIGLAGIARASMELDEPPRELVQFVHEAKRRGLNDDKIKQQAIAVGWSSATVDAALEYDKSGKIAPEANGNSPKPPELKSRPDPVSNQPPAFESKAPIEPASLAGAEPASAKSGRAEEKGGGPSIRQSASPSPDYQVSAGDALQITVWKQPELTVPNEIVRPDGKITVPLIKDVEVAGLAPAQVEAAITTRLVEFITDPNVTVIVTAMGPKSVYVTGRVKKEGPVAYTNGMTVLQAISEAGGLTDFAKRKKIYVLHTENGREYRSDFNYEEVVHGLRMEQNIVLFPNDTVVVPR